MLLPVNSIICTNELGKEALVIDFIFYAILVIYKNILGKTKTKPISSATNNIKQKMGSDSLIPLYYRGPIFALTAQLLGFQKQSTNRKEKQKPCFA